MFERVSGDDNFGVTVPLAVIVILMTTLLYFCQRRRKSVTSKDSSAANGTQDNSSSTANGTQDRLPCYDALLQRHLGSMESTLYQVQKQGMEMVSNVFVIASKLRCSEQLLGLAVALLAERHPLLRMRILSRNNQLSFEEAEYLRVEMDVDRESSNWQEKLESELSSVTPDGGPLWRATYLPNATQGYSDEQHPHQHTFVFTFNHAIIDGTSIMTLMGDLLQLVEQLHDEGPCEEFQITSLPLPPTAEDVAEYINGKRPSVFWSRALFVVPLARLTMKMLMSRMGRNKWMSERKRLCKDCPLRQQETRVVPVQLSESQTSLLVSRCRKESVTVLSAFSAATSLALAELLKTGNQNEKDGVNIHTNITVDLRRRFYHSQNGNLAKSRDPDMLDHVAALFAWFPVVATLKSRVAENDFWDLARTYKTSIHSNINERAGSALEKFQIYRKIVGTGFSPFDEDEGRSPIDMTHNNFGHIEELNRPTDSPFKAKAFYACAAGHNAGPTLRNTLVTFEGTLFWTMSYFTNVMSREEAESFVSKTMICLLEATEAYGE